MAIKLLVINLFTLIRVIGTVILIPIYKVKGGVVAGVISLICYLTDSIDGFLARKWEASTFFGALFDGIADKLFTIINFVLLYLITPYALIPIIFEILIIVIQLIKFNKNLNIKSNLVGKFKVWVLAICIVLTFFISDISSITILPLEFKSFILDVPKERLYFSLLLPAIVMEFFTFISYIVDFIKNNKVECKNKEKIDVKINDYKNNWDRYKNVWLSPEFYKEHKNDSNLKELRKLTK